ncbi:MAG: hypothetical protein V1736_06770 [Pseudomonadota bacterium]
MIASVLVRWKCTLCEKAVEIKGDQPKRSHQAINLSLKSPYDTQVAR